MTKLQKLNFYELNTNKVLDEKDVLAKDLSSGEKQKQKGGFVHSRKKKTKKK